MISENKFYVEEFDILTGIQSPYIIFYPITAVSKKKVSQMVLLKKTDEILLINDNGFLIDSVFAGLSEEHIEYIAKNAPQPYKENVLKILRDKEMMKGVFEIVEDMDDDLGRDVKKNQERIQSVIQYFKDNKVAFEF